MGQIAFCSILCLLRILHYDHLPQYPYYLTLGLMLIHINLQRPVYIVALGTNHEEYDMQNIMKLQGTVSLLQFL